MKKVTNSLLNGFAVVIFSATCQASFAGVSAAEAAKLGGELTPMGAEKAGNSDSTIPAWTGGYTQGAASGYKSGGPRKNLFPADKPRLKIDAKNLQQYESKLSEGVKKLLRDDPNFYLNVYETRRTAAAPSWVYDAIKKNAVTASTEDDGNILKNAINGIPFPIPKTGKEVMWNSLTNFRGVDTVDESTTWFVPTGGAPIFVNGSNMHWNYPYYLKGNTFENLNGEGKGILGRAFLETTAPAIKAGEGLIVNERVDKREPFAWQYLPGQRRVRRMPALGYDIPDFATSGVAYFDEAWGFSGAMDRFDWKIVGKKELIVPYNANGFLEHKVEDVMGAKFLKPDLIRWELHRVWQVEATLRNGERHPVVKRQFYVDEDSWMVLLSDGWDAKGTLWKMVYQFPVVIPELPALVQRPFGVVDFLKGNYVVNIAVNGSKAQFKVLDIPRPESFWSPDAMAARSVR